MELTSGSVVRSKAGHDKYDFFVVVDFDEKYVTVCDGKRRPLSKPKRKKEKHLAVTNSKIPKKSLETDKKIREALSDFK